MAVSTEPAPAMDTPAADGAVVEKKEIDVQAMVAPLLAQVEQWSKQLQPIVAQSGTAVKDAVAPVAAAINAWSQENVDPLVKKGGEEVKKALEPALKALQELLAKLEPYLTSIQTAVADAVRPAWEAILALIERLKPLVLQGMEALKTNGAATAIALAEWNKTQLQPWAATTGHAIKVSSIAAAEQAKVKSIEAAAAAKQWNEEQFQPWAKKTGDELKENTVKTVANVQQWNDEQFKPWVANTAVPTATKWWQEALVCFCVPLSQAVATAGLKDQAAALKALAPEKEYPAAQVVN